MDMLGEDMFGDDYVQVINGYALVKCAYPEME